MGICTCAKSKRSLRISRRCTPTWRKRPASLRTSCTRCSKAGYSSRRDHAEARGNLDSALRSADSFRPRTFDGPTGSVRYGFGRLKQRAYDSGFDAGLTNFLKASRARKDAAAGLMTSGTRLGRAPNRLCCAHRPCESALGCARHFDRRWRDRRRHRVAWRGVSGHIRWRSALFSRIGLLATDRVARGQLEDSHRHAERQQQRLQHRRELPRRFGQASAVR